MTLAYESKVGTGRRKAAIALVAMGAERAAALLRGLDENEIRLLAAEVAALGPVTPDEVSSTLRDLRTGISEISTLPAPGPGYARDLLVRALGPDHGDRLAAEVEAPPPFRWLGEADPDQVAEALAVEPAGVVALALAHLPGKEAAAVLSRLPEDMRGEVALRIATLSNVHPITVEEVDALLRPRVAQVLATEVVPVAGAGVLADILGFTGREEERQMLSVLSERSPELAEKVREALFTFEDVAQLEPRALQTLLKAVDTRELALALKSADEVTLSRVLSNLSERARESLLEEIDLLSAIRQSDVAAARQSIVGTARRLEEEGSIVITRPGEDE